MALERQTQDKTITTLKLLVTQPCVPNGDPTRRAQKNTRLNLHRVLNINGVRHFVRVSVIVVVVVVGWRRYALRPIRIGVG